MISKRLNEIVREYYLSGRLDESFVMDAVKHTLGGDVKRATSNEDREKHIDFWWKSPRKGVIGIDVKGIKKNSRNDSQLDDTINWLELKSVDGKPGWLYGQAEYIAFRTFTKILFVKRDKLLEFALEKIKDKDIVGYNPKDFYIPYKRFKRQDVILKVPTSDLEKMCDFCIDCENE